MVLVATNYWTLRKTIINPFTLLHFQLSSIVHRPMGAGVELPQSGTSDHARVVVPSAAHSPHPSGCFGSQPEVQ